MEPAARPTRILARLAIILCLSFPMLGICSQTARPPAPAQATDQDKPSPQIIYRIEDGVTGPRPLFTPEPEYPDRARKKKIQGDVVISGYVGADGAFHDPVVTQSVEKSLDANAVAAVRRWKFDPCTKDGHPVNCEMKVEVGFHLYGSK